MDAAREKFVSVGAMLYQNPRPLEVSVDLSLAGVSYAWALSYEATGKVPQILLVAPGGYHDAERIVSHLQGPLLTNLAVIVASWLDPDAWLLGNVDAPGGWVGSEGA